MHPVLDQQQEVQAGAFTHMFVALFTAAPMTSWLAFGEGICSALLFGFLSGGILAWSYNVSTWSERKS